MATSKKLIWDNTGERIFSAGVEKGVLYPSGTAVANSDYAKGVAWNGLTAVNESPSGGEPNAIWADDIKYANIMSTEDFGCSIEAYTYPDEFAECDGSAVLEKGVYVTQQKRRPFGFSYVTKLGNDVDGLDFGYRIHLVYGCLAAPASKDHSTINDSPDAETMSWDVSTTPVDVPGRKPSAHIYIDSTKVDEAFLTKVEAALYGTDTADPYLPTPAKLIALKTAA